MHPFSPVPSCAHARPGSALGPRRWEPLRPVLTHAVASSRLPSAGPGLWQSGLADLCTDQTQKATSRRVDTRAAPAPSWVLSAGSPGGQGEGARPPQGGTHERGRQVTCGQDTLTGLALGTGTRVLNAAISIPNSNPMPRPPFKGKPTNTTVGFEPLIEIKKMNSKRTECCKRSAKGDPAAAPERRVRVPLDTPTNSGHFGSCICCEVLAKSPQIHIFWLCYF